MLNSTIIESKEYFPVDTKEKITISDSYVVNDNKLGKGHGEAKLYIGAEGKDVRNFYGSHGFVLKCFVLKDNLESFIKDLEDEYQSPQLPYRGAKKFPKLYKERIKKISKMDSRIWFDMHEQIQIKGTRIYIKSNNKTDLILREFALKHLSYLSFHKLQTKEGDVIFRARLFVGTSYIEDKTITKKENDKKETEVKYRKTQTRDWQVKFREDVLKETQSCPVTLIADDRLLEAAHIKPQNKCPRSEKIDPKNGIMLTSTMHKLFDLGWITFDENKKLKLSPWMSKVTCMRLHLKDGEPCKTLPVQGREKYLKYHREDVFKS